MILEELPVQIERREHDAIHLAKVLRRPLDTRPYRVQVTHPRGSASCLTMARSGAR